MIQAPKETESDQIKQRIVESHEGYFWQVSIKRKSKKGDLGKLPDGETEIIMAGNEKTLEDAQNNVSNLMLEIRRMVEESERQ